MRNRVDRSALIVGFVVVGLLALSLASPAVAAPRGGFASEELFREGNDWEPDVAVDPGSSYAYMVTTGIDAKECRQCPVPSILLRASPDGGGSWSAPRFVCGTACRSGSSSGPWQADPIVRVADDGTVYVAWLDGWNPAPVVSKSRDHGITWTKPVLAGKSGAGWADKPWLAISPDGRDVYVAFNQGDPFIAASHDSGDSFGTPVKLTAPTNRMYWYPEGGVVAADRTAYFSMSIETPFGDGPVDLVVVKSADGGASWSVIPIDHSEEYLGCTVSACITDEFQAQIVLDVDSTGVLMVAYMKNAAPGEPKKFYSRISTDGGTTWSLPSVINDVADSDFPAITHGPTAGDFRVAWQDDRNGPRAWNTWYKRTTNYGGRWSGESRLSDRGSGAAYKTPEGYAFPYGDYFGIAADSDGMNFVIWGEGTGRATFGNCWFTRGA